MIRDDVDRMDCGFGCHPADTDYPATDLAATGMRVAPEAFFTALSLKMLGRLAQWNGGDGFSTIRTDWLARAAGIGRDVVVRLAGTSLTGCFEALDATGALVLRLPDGSTMTFAAGDLMLASIALPKSAR